MIDVNPETSEGIKCTIMANGQIESFNERFSQFINPEIKNIKDCIDKEFSDTFFQVVNNIRTEGKTYKILLPVKCKADKTGTVITEVSLIKVNNSINCNFLPFPSGSEKPEVGINIYNQLLDKIPALIIDESQNPVFISPLFKKQYSLPPSIQMSEVLQKVFTDEDGILNKQNKTFFGQSSRLNLSIAGISHPNQNNIRQLLITMPFLKKDRKHYLVLLPNHKDLNFDIDAILKKEDEINKFIYKVSHDFKGPLTSLSSVIKLAEDEIKDPVAANFISMIKMCGDRLEDLVAGLLDLSRILVNPLTPEKIQIENIVNEVIEEVREKEAELSTGINFIVKTTQKEEFINDARLVRNILKEPILNGIIFKKRNRPDQTINIDISIKDKVLHVKIEDNGIGIDAVKLPNIFNMFYRGSEYSKGSGLGLYMTKTAVEKLKGRIEVSSLPDKGTVISITLPQIE